MSHWSTETSLLHCSSWLCTMSRLLARPPPVSRLQKIPAPAFSRSILSRIPHNHGHQNSVRNLQSIRQSLLAHSPPCRRTVPPAAFPPLPGSIASFHSTPRTESLPLIPLLATVLKASTSMELARTAARITLTFFPFLLLLKRKARRHIKLAELLGNPPSPEKRSKIMRKLKINNFLLQLLLFVPFTLFWATIIASLERTPLTGRWRLIILSPEEEDEIAAQLAGSGWYQAVGDILQEDGPPRIVPPNDWRYQWVNETLRRLETTIPILIREPDLCPNWIERGPDGLSPPMPPPAEYPLRPRPRASEYLRWICEKMCDRTPPPVPHAVPGPPYSLLVVDKSTSNAFSYGFGPDGGGGIVVYTGFLDEILAKQCPTTSEPPLAQPEEQESSSWWSRVFGSIFSPPSPPPRHPTPTQEQTTELAILLAHELAHLVLSHHLETLSSATVIVPGTLSMAADIIRVLIFPVTMLFGPFVNDAVAQLGKIGSGEFAQMGEYFTSVKQEIEADVVSARLLAHAGFDAREAVKFWESRSASTTECANIDNKSFGNSNLLAMRIMGDTHPVNAVRVEKLKEELVRWEKERLAALKRMETERARANAAA
ncbi:hypothetical protein AX16_002680 [Volvariella volvacea WC 439]|nr:hypothetical protein AX16_002680 [Volvariella volvacea WC 439]